MEVWIGVISALVGVVAGAVATMVTTRQRVDLEHRAAFDRELRALRMPHYQALHHVSERLPREWKACNEPARADLFALREAFHQWYFGPDAGGMFLTENAREKYYFDLMNELQLVGQRSGENPTAALTPQEQLRLLTFAHDLRQQLRQDLGTAEPPKLQWTARGLTPAPPPEPATEPGSAELAHLTQPGRSPERQASAAREDSQ